MYATIPKPRKRSVPRMLFGKTLFTLRRRAFWLFGGFKFARICADALPSAHFTHSTPLLRQLKNADMHLQRNKITNLRIAVSRINGVTIYPGEVFSYWRLIGKPSKRRGYLEGMVLQNGKVTSGTGGGLCQLSNLIYWMTLHTPLTVIERHRHGYDVFPDSGRTQPFASGATCFYNYVDLMIKNETEHPYQLVLEVTDTELAGAWKSDEPPEYRFEVYEKEHFIRSEYWGGYTRHNLLHRRRYGLKGSPPEDEFVAQNHAVMMYSPLLPE